MTFFDAKSHHDSVNPLYKYAADHSLRLEPVHRKLMEETLKHPRSIMMGAPEVTQLLQNLIKNKKMKKVIEVGSYTGFSTLGFALALPDDGKVVACEVSTEFADIGIPFFKEAKVDHKIDLRIQSAEKTLDELLADGLAGTFDLAFIDADKVNYDVYYEKCLQLMCQGGIVAIDNVLWWGSVLEENPTRIGAKEIKALNAKLVKDERVDISLLAFGDGLTLAFKR